MTSPTHKICSSPDCAAKGAAQPVEAFGANVNAPDGLNWYCKSCHAAKQRAWKLANPDKVRRQRRDYMQRVRARNAERRLNK
jgi:hypothetical protein